ncbi:MAG TPA: ketoisovalerate oxidoreductase [Clostridiales bacterium]|nr:ketoisovalerate oxidoreductase [Clostridiales bacterium]
MTEILWHGRGGQGAFTAAKLLGAAYALKNDNSYALAFPSFGPERRGAPIRAFTKVSTTPIKNRSEVSQADYIIFLDDTLFSVADFQQLKPNGKIIINTKKKITDGRVITLDGDRIAADIMHMPISNTVMLGAFAAVFQDVSVDNILTAIEEYMPAKLHNKNKAVVTTAEKIISQGAMG